MSLRSSVERARSRGYALVMCLTALGTPRPSAAQPDASAAPPGTPLPAPTPELPLAPAAELPLDDPLASPVDGDADGAFVPMEEDGSSPDAEGPKLDLYGFADFSYMHVLADEQSIWPEILTPNPSFYVGHLNVYANSTLSPLWRSLVEVRFTYLPSGVETVNADGTTTLVQTFGTDPTEYGFDMPWGGINIERAWLEFKPYAAFAIRAGSWLTPYGFYNDDHGTPTILSLHRPFIIADQPFPTRQSGLHVYGRFPLGWLDLGYDLTLSNGRGSLDQFNDWDSNKAVGGRLSLDARGFGDLHLGLALYKGRYTAARRVYSLTTINGEPASDIQIVPDVSYRELSLGGEARFQHGPLLIQGEIMLNEAAYDERQRERLPSLTATPEFTADYRRWGYYALVGYTLPWLYLTPYIVQEYYNFANWSIVPPAHTFSIGLNFRPTPSVALKASYMTAIFTGWGSTGIGVDALRILAAQAAWAF